MNRCFATWTLVALAIGWMPPALAESSSPAVERKEMFGAVVAPAALPSGAIAAYGLVGAPELGIGFREGFGGWELEVAAKLNYLQLSIAAELLAKLALVHDGPFDLAPFLGLGLVADTGSRYFDLANFAYVGPRALVGAIASYRVVETVRGILDLRLPWDIALGSGGGQFRPSVGAGAEIYLGNDITGLLLGRLGMDELKEPGGVPVFRVGWAAQLGIGFRLF